jgi:hypothetical protein
MMMGMNQNMCFPFRRHCTLYALRSLRFDRATVRLRLSDNNRERYTNTHVVLHANSRPDGLGVAKLLRRKLRRRTDLRHSRIHRAATDSKLRTASLCALCIPLNDVVFRAIFDKRPDVYSMVCGK